MALDQNSAKHRSDNLATGASYWQRARTPEHASAPTAPPADSDVIIIGGGLAGLSTAIGVLDVAPFSTVTVLESAFVGAGASGRAGGLLSPLAAPIWLLTADRNPEHAWALRTLRTLIDEQARWLAHSIPESEVAAETLTLEAKGSLTAHGLKRLSGILKSATVRHRLHSSAHGPSGTDRMTLLAHTVNPYGTVQGLARHARLKGASIHEYTAVSRIDDGASGATVTLADGRVLTARTVVVCTNAYSDRIAMPKRPKATVVSNYMLATKPLSAADQAIIAKSGTFTVELNGAYVFYRLHQGRLLFGGVEKFGRPGDGSFIVPADVRAKLERQLALSFPGITPPRIDTAWGGQFHMTSTDLPVIQRAGGNAASSILMNVGYGGTGIALTLALGAVVGALAVRTRALEPDDERLLAIMQATRLPIGDIARQVGRIGWELLSRSTSGLAFSAPVARATAR